MAGFVLNDIFDEERDRLNHPDRPIPSGRFSPVSATLLYFGLLATALLAAKVFVPDEQLFLYLTFALLFSNYNFLVEKAPLLKNAYVAAVSIIPVWIVADFLSLDGTRYALAAALLLFIFGREVLMDVVDMRGDGPTLAKRLGAPVSVKLGFALQGVAILSLVIQSTSAIHALSIGTMLVGMGVFIYMWRKERQRPIAIHLMKLQIACAYAFLIF